MKTQINKKSLKLRGFSLIEMAMVLLVIGIIAGSVFKGKDVVEMAQIRSIVSDIENIRMAYANYVSTYGNIENVSDIFPKLHEAGLIPTKEFKTPKIGGKYEIILEKGMAKVQIVDSSKNGIMSKKQVMQLKSKVIESIGSDIVETDPQEITDEKVKYIVKIAIN